MNVRKHLMVGLALTGLALGLSTFKANAQQDLNGTFDLPEATYWGNTLLQPGRYTISMSTEADDMSRIPSIHLSGEGSTQPFSPLPHRRMSPGATIWTSPTLAERMSFGRLIPACSANRFHLA